MKPVPGDSMGTSGKSVPAISVLSEIVSGVIFVLVRTAGDNPIVRGNDVEKGQDSKNNTGSMFSTYGGYTVPMPVEPSWKTFLIVLVETCQTQNHGDSTLMKRVPGDIIEAL